MSEKPPHKSKINAVMKAHQFKKGKSGNPGGLPKNPAVTALRNLTIKEYREVIELALVSNLEALAKLANDPATSAVQMGVARALMNAVKKGDFDIIERLATRIVGKIPDKLEVTSKNESAITILDQAKVAEANKNLENDF